MEELLPEAGTISGTAIADYIRRLSRRMREQEAQRRYEMSMEAESFALQNQSPYLEYSPRFVGEDGNQRAQINRIQRRQTALMERPAGEPWKLPKVLTGDDYEDERYIAVAKDIGLNVEPVLQPRIERFFVARGWLIYPYQKVWEFLQQLARIENERNAPSMHNSWPVFAPRVVPVWRPLRSSDTVNRPRSVYDKAVPLHAIEKVLALETEFGKGSLTFHVSDYEAQTPDPFLMVMAGLQPYVIDVWDEPSFR
jgi:hypothetical protein